MSLPLISKLPLWVTASNWLLVVLSTLMALVGLEGALQIRQMLWYRTTAAEQERLALTQTTTLRLHRRSQDPVLKYETRPGAVVERDGVLYRINAQGLRDDTDVPPKQAGERRLVVLGDSIAFGLGVDQEWTFTHLIENALHKTRPMTRVLNHSVLGYATDQEVRLFERDGWSLEPDGVVVAFCLNDFDDYSGELPLFDPSTHLAEGGFRRLAPRRLGGVELPEPLPLLDRSLFFRKLSERLLRVDYYRWIGTDVERRQRVAAALGQLGNALSSRGLPHFLVIFPILVDHGSYPYTDIHRFVSERATAAGFKVVDLLEAFSTESLAALRLQPNDVLHLNKRGHMVTARVLAPCLADPALHCP